MPKKKTANPREEIPPGYEQREPAAIYIGQSKSRLDQEKAAGKIPYYKLSPKLVLFKISDLDAYMDQFRVDPCKLSLHETPKRERAARGRFKKRGGE